MRGGAPRRTRQPVPHEETSARVSGSGAPLPLGAWPSRGGRSLRPVPVTCCWDPTPRPAVEDHTRHLAASTLGNRVTAAGSAGQGGPRPSQGRTTTRRPHPSTTGSNSVIRQTGALDATPSPGLPALPPPGGREPRPALPSGESPSSPIVGPRKEEGGPVEKWEAGKAEAVVRLARTTLPGLRTTVSPRESLSRPPRNTGSSRRKQPSRERPPRVTRLHLSSGACSHSGSRPPVRPSRLR